MISYNHFTSASFVVRDLGLFIGHQSIVHVNSRIAYVVSVYLCILSNLRAEATIMWNKWIFTVVVGLAWVRSALVSYSHAEPLGVSRNLVRTIGPWQDPDRPWQHVKQVADFIRLFHACTLRFPASFLTSLRPNAAFPPPMYSRKKPSLFRILEFGILFSDAIK